MAKKHGKSPRRAPHRSATRRSAPTRTHSDEHDLASQPLISGLRMALRAPDAGAFLVAGGQIARQALLMEGEEHAPDWVTLLGSFVEIDIAETTAVLHLAAAMTEDQLLRRRLRHVLATRRQPMPPTVSGIADARVTEAWFMDEELGDGDELILGVSWPDGSAVSAVVYIDHNMGTIIKDAFVIGEPGHVVADRFIQLAERQGESVELAQTDLADARARIEQALANLDILHPDWEQDEWPMCRPIIELFVRTMPEGGEGYAEGPVADGVVDDVVEGFLASPFAADLPDDEATRAAAEGLFAFTLDHSEDPLRWSHVVVEVCLTGGIAFDPNLSEEALDRVPEVLAAVVRYAHHEKGVSPDSTALTLASIDTYLPDFEELRQDPRLVQMRENVDLIEAMMAGDMDPFYREGLLERLGSEQAVRDLDADPLPDEPLDLTGLDDDVAARLTAISAHIDELVADPPGEAFDVEFRTACRRFLTAVARTGPEVILRRAKDLNTAAAVVYVIANENVLTNPYGPVTSQDLLAHMGVRSSPASRAKALQGAVLGEQPEVARDPMGDPGLLVSSHRRRLIELRDRWWPEDD